MWRRETVLLKVERKKRAKVEARNGSFEGGEEKTSVEASAPGNGLMADGT